MIVHGKVNIGSLPGSEGDNSEKGPSSAPPLLWGPGRAAVHFGAPLPGFESRGAQQSPSLSARSELGLVSFLLHPHSCKNHGCHRGGDRSPVFLWGWGGGGGSALEGGHHL